MSQNEMEMEGWRESTAGRAFAMGAEHTRVGFLEPGEQSQPQEHTCNPRAGEEGQRQVLGARANPQSLLAEFQPSERPCLKKQVDGTGRIGDKVVL